MNKEGISEKSPKKHRIVRVLLRIFAVLLAFLIAIVLLINVPAVQTYLTKVFVNSIREKTGTELSIGSVKIAFPKKVVIGDVFVEDQKKDTLLYLHSLKINVDLFELFHNRIVVNDLELEKVVANIRRDDPEGDFNFGFIIDALASKNPDTTSKSAPWSFRLNNISLSDIRGEFIDERSGINIHGNVSDLSTNVKAFDPGKDLYQVNDLRLKNSDVKIAMKSMSDKNEANTSDRNNPKQEVKKIFPSINISLGKIFFENVNFKYDDNGYPLISDQVDYRHLDVKNLSAFIAGTELTEKGILASIESLSFQEKSGFHLLKCSTVARINNEKAELENIFLESSKSKIGGNAKLNYSSIDDLSIHPENCTVNIDIQNSLVNTSDLYLFVPEIAKLSQLQNLKGSTLNFGIKAKGKLNDLNIETVELSALQKTTFVAHGQLAGLPDVEKVHFNMKVDLLTTIPADLFRFVKPENLSGIHLPSSMNLNGTVKGSTHSVQTDFKFNSEYGVVIANASYQIQRDGSNMISSDFRMKDLMPGKLLGDTIFGKANLSGNLLFVQSRKGESDIEANIVIGDAVYNNYQYKNIEIESTLKKDIVSANINSADTNFHFDLSAMADISRPVKKISAEMSVAKANLKSLNISEQTIDVTTKLKAELEYSDINNAKISLSLLNTKLSGDSSDVTIKQFDVSADASDQGMSMMLNSDFLDGKVGGTIKANDLPKVIVKSFHQYFGMEDTVKLHPEQSLSFSMNVHLPQDLIDIVAPKLKGLEVSKFEGDFSGDNNRLSLDLDAPMILYSDVLLDTVRIHAEGQGEKLSMEISSDKISYSKFSIEKFAVNARTDNGSILSEVSVRDHSDSLSYLISNSIRISDKRTEIKFLPDGLKLSGNLWKVNPENTLVIESGKESETQYSIHHFVFDNGEQSFGLRSDDEGNELLFTKYSLPNLLNIVSFKSGDGPAVPFGKIVKGDLDGKVVVASPGQEQSFSVDMLVNELSIFDTLGGKLSLKAKAENDILQIDAGLWGDQNFYRLNGLAKNYSGIPEFDLKAEFDIDNLSRIESISLGTLSQMSGKVNGSMSVKGTTEKPLINGEINFEKTAFRVNSLNFYANIENDKIEVSEKGIHFDNFVVKDENNKELKIKGDIFTKDLKTIDLDLNLAANQFQPVNSTVADNKTFYGKLSLGADVTLKGNINNPEIRTNIQIDSTTDLTYALPGSELKLVSSEGIVQFLDSLQLLDSTLNVIESNYMRDSIISKMKGYDLKAHIEIDPGAKFTVDIDPNSGDYLTISGKAKLDIGSDKRTGEQTINGTYEVREGFYELSFYDLVKKKFTILPGSTVAWSGKPMDADLNITAEYIVRTSSVALVANETSAMSDEEKKIFNRRLPFEVKLNIGGMLSKPDISFNITLPQQYLNNNPLVETKLRQLNAPEMEAQLNKQVFALLVAGSFMAENPMVATGSSSSNLASTAARNSVNGILASQLNNMSGKYISGVDVNFGLTSYEDYSSGSGDTRTEMDVQVSKKLFNDRVTVEAENSFGLKGAKNENPTNASAQGYGQFAVIYSLTETGEYKLRAYYQNAYDPFDGDISYSGIAFIFEKEFDRRKQIRPPLAEPSVKDTVK